MVIAGKAFVPAAGSLAAGARPVDPEHVEIYRLDHCGPCRDAVIYGWAGTAAEEAHAAHLPVVEVGALTGTSCACRVCAPKLAGAVSDAEA